MRGCEEGTEWQQGECIKRGTIEPSGSRCPVLLRSDSAMWRSCGIFERRGAIISILCDVTQLQKPSSPPYKHPASCNTQGDTPGATCDRLTWLQAHPLTSMRCTAARDGVVPRHRWRQWTRTLAAMMGPQRGARAWLSKSSRQRRWGSMRFGDIAKSCVSNDVICPIQEEGSNQRASGRVGSFQTDRKVPAG